MPPAFVPLVAPDYSSSGDSTATASRGSSYLLFKPHVGDSCRFFKPAYDKVKKPLTVFRPFPCRSFSKPNEFEPYRRDAGGTDRLGFWIKRLYVAWNVGRPATTFIVHNPDRDGVYDSRMNPLSVLSDAVHHAVKKGQGKASEWGDMIKRPYEPEAKTVLEWSGYREGSARGGASLRAPSELFLMQGMVLRLDTDMLGANKEIPGWRGCNYTCVFGLTSGVGHKLLNQLNLEKEGFRGNPADFENRFVNGDPVSLSSGRFLYIYPLGGDPRKAQQAESISDIYGHNRSQQDNKSGGKDEAGFDIHMEKFYGAKFPASIPQQYHEVVYSKWRHWDELRRPDGEIGDRGILWYPNYVEQAQLLGRIFPADMLEYAFFGGHSDWLTQEIREKAVAARKASVPAAPPPATNYRPAAVVETPVFDNPFGAVDTPETTDNGNWGASIEDNKVKEVKEVADSVVQDQTLVDCGDSSVDELFARLSAGVEQAVGEDAVAESSEATVAAEFDPKPEDHKATQERTKQSVAALAAAKAAARKKTDNVKPAE